MANSKYELTIDNTKFRFLEDVEMADYKFSLEKLTYDKGIYQPAEMTVTMNVGGKNINYQDLVNAFRMKPVLLTINVDNGYEAAKNYFVFMVRPLFRKVALSSSVKLELTIYSQDKLMTLDKYSKAWSGKRLGKQIFAEEVKGFKFDNASIATNAGNVNGTDGDLKVIDYNTGEFIQPYLVQYNESFYDFMRRTANRCGEFLYHDNGQLHLGIKVTDKTGTDFAKDASERYYEDIVCEGTDTSDYAYDYLAHHSSPSASDKPYSDPLTYDDYLHDIDPTYTDFKGEYGRWDSNLVGSICMALEGTSFSKILGNTLADKTFKMYEAWQSASSLNADYMKVNIAPWTGKTEQTKGENVNQFGTAMDQQSQISEGYVNLNAKFYALVRKAEKKVSENAVHLEFGEKTKKLFIGDMIKVDGLSYLVIGVKGSCDLEGLLLKEQQQVIAVKLYTVGTNNVPLPPYLPDTAVRESKAQLAFVTDTMDPKHIGRVRVRFAWQAESGDASPWIRVQMPFASDGGGVKFTPEEGDEVMVSFEEDNIERPYVSGYLLSPRSNASFGDLPNRSITSKNGHSITFNDGDDGLSFYTSLFPAVKTIESLIPTTALPEKLKSFDQCRQLTGGMTLSDRYGLYKINLSSDSREVAIQSAMGNVTINAFTGITISAPNGDINIVGKNVNIEASNTVNIESGKAIKNRFFPDKHKYQENGVSWQTYTKRLVGDIGINMGRGLVSRTADKILDLNLLRTIIETISRPIDGTTKIKSYTFVQIEAGKGSTEYPLDARRDNVEPIINNLNQAIDVTATTAGARVDAIHTAHDQMCDAITTFNDLGAENGPNHKNAISFNMIKAAAWKEDMGDLTYNWQEAELDVRSAEELQQDRDNALNTSNENKPDPNNDKYNADKHPDGKQQYDTDMQKWHRDRSEIFKKHKSAMSEMRKKLNKQAQVTAAAEHLRNKIHDVYLAVQSFSSNQGFPHTDYSKFVEEAMGHQNFKDINLTVITSNTTKMGDDWKKLKCHYMREAVRSLLAGTSIGNKTSDLAFTIGKPATADNLEDPGTWEDIVKSLVVEEAAPASYGEEKLRNIKKWWENVKPDPLSSIVNRKRWKTGVEGKILLSDNPNKTITFNKNGNADAQWNVVATDKTPVALRNKLLGIGSIN